MSFEIFPYSNFHDMNLDWIINQWLDMKKSFSTYEEAFKDLKKFVDGYFENLDVQKEINAKLDSMVDDGTFIKLITPLISNDSYPKFVDDVSKMTDTKLVYVLSTNAHIYYYNKTWIDSGLVYGSFNSYTPSDILVSPSNISTYFNNLDNAPLNKTIFLYNITSKIMENLPTSPIEYGVLSTFQYSPTSTQPGGYQLLITKDEVYIRLNYGDLNNYHWLKWNEIDNSKTYGSSEVIVTPDNINTYFNNLNNAPLNKTVFLFNITSDIMENLPNKKIEFGLLSTFQFSQDFKQPGGYQLLVTSDGLYSRINWGSYNDNYSWTAWTTNANKQNYILAFNLFRSFCTIGDSLSVGYHTLKNGTKIEEDKSLSWPSYIKNKYNNTVYWSGKSGATCKSWLNEKSNEWGVNYLKTIPVQPLYILCMGANESGIPIGTVNDIGTTNDTLYAYVSKVIQEVKNYAPDSIIISTGIGRGEGIYESVININNVYKEMEKHFENYFYIDCMNDLNKIPFTSLYNNFHYTPLGYSAIAELYETKITELVNNNIDKFLYS